MRDKSWASLQIWQTDDPTFKREVEFYGLKVLLGEPPASACAAGGGAEPGIGGAPPALWLGAPPAWGAAAGGGVGGGVGVGFGAPPHAGAAGPSFSSTDIEATRDAYSRYGYHYNPTADGGYIPGQGGPRLQIMSISALDQFRMVEKSHEEIRLEDIAKAGQGFGMPTALNQTPINSWPSTDAAGVCPPVFGAGAPPADLKYAGATGATGAAAAGDVAWGNKPWPAFGDSVLSDGGPPV